jgi:hypothetical protein
LGGDLGSDVETLRGTRGADYENSCRIARGVEGVGYGCFCRSDEKDRLIFIKGTSCFVFSSENAPAPMYAISLVGVRAIVKSSTATVRLESSLGDTLYNVTFPTHDDAKRFADVLSEQASTAETDQLRKRLGHDMLLNKRTSQLHAEAIAEKTLKDQPDAPIAAHEIMANLPMSPL